VGTALILISRGKTARQNRPGDRFTFVNGLNSWKNSSEIQESKNQVTLNVHDRQINDLFKALKKYDVKSSALSLVLFPTRIFLFFVEKTSIRLCQQINNILCQMLGLEVGGFFIGFFQRYE